MTKEEKRAYSKAHYIANREAYINRAKKRRESQPEAVAAQQKAYREANKDKVAARKKAYYNANQEKIRARVKAQRATLVDDFYTMYYIPQHHYIGVTNQPKRRLSAHREVGKDTEGWEVVYTFKTKREALDMERKFHDVLGYNGKNANYK
tara:strand:+ start:488 stop:937 length:450 start_codon:yes stop_codon:yes gene_type:complete